MQRLFSTFPDGWPGTGLLLLRVALALVLFREATPGLFGVSAMEPTTWQWAAAAAGLFLLAGLWTPITGALVGVIEFSAACFLTGDHCNCMLLGSLGFALAMLGPGAWSVDARLCGRRRIEIPTR